MALSRLLESLFAKASDEPAEQTQARLAAAVLLVEIASADFDQAEDELAVIRTHLGEQFGLAPEDAQALLDEARHEHDATTCLAPYAQIFNQNSDRDTRLRLLEGLWRVALADGVIDRHEELMMRRIADMLYLSHADYIQAKLRVGAD